MPREIGVFRKLILYFTNLDNLFKYRSISDLSNAPALDLSEQRPRKYDTLILRDDKCYEPTN